jgi:acetyl-CoA synthetase
MKTLKISTFSEYEKQYEFSVSNPELFWDGVASSFLWTKKWDKTLTWNFDEPKVRWFEGATMNITENIFERNLPLKKDQLALIWEANNPSQKNKTYTFEELHHSVNQCANGLKALGITKGDRICIYLPMVPELTIAVLACARIGAVHSVVFAGFSATSLSDRINDAEAKLVITSDGLNRGAKQMSLKELVDEAISTTTSIEKVLVLKVTNDECPITESRDIWWHELIQNQSIICPAEVMNSEDNLFILYTSGSTGKPKGVVHTCGGYMVYTAYTFMNVYQYEDGDIHWCTADIGWITGHSYIIYGPLLCGATTVMFEGIPTYPDASRFWEIVD